MNISERFFGLASLIILTVGFVVVTALTGSVVWLTLRASDQTAWVSHTLRVEAQVADVLALAERSESMRRAYLLTAAERDAAAIRKTIGNLKSSVDELRALVPDNPAEAARASRMSDLIAAHLGEIRTTLDSPQAEGREHFIHAPRGNLTEVRNLAAAMSAAEASLQSARSASADWSVRALLIVTIAAMIGILALGLGSVWLVRNYFQELRRSRDELADINDGLAEVVQERTADVLQANREIQRFAYVVSHDLRAPLVNIMGFTSEIETGIGDVTAALDKAVAAAPDLDLAAARQAVDEDWPEAIGFIRASSEKMDRLINAILRLSREGRRTFTPERLHTTAMLEAIVAALQHQIEERNIDVRIETLPEITSDRLAFDQVFGNLVDNAVKYLEDDRAGQIVVRGRDRGRQVEFEIEDNGRGIGEQDRERVFELFRRAGPQNRPGEGIGLAHVRTLVRRLGGSITFESELGRGTTFRILLPKTLPKGLSE